MNTEVNYFRLAALKGAVKLESKGMKRRGPSAKSIACGLLGLPTRTTSHATVIEKLQAIMDQALEQRREEVARA